MTNHPNKKTKPTTTVEESAFTDGLSPGTIPLRIGRLPLYPLGRTMWSDSSRSAKRELRISRLSVIGRSRDLHLLSVVQLAGRKALEQARQRLALRIVRKFSPAKMVRLNLDHLPTTLELLGILTLRCHLRRKEKCSRSQRIFSYPIWETFRDWLACSLPQKLQKVCEEFGITGSQALGRHVLPSKSIPTYFRRLRTNGGTVMIQPGMKQYFWTISIRKERVFLTTLRYGWIGIPVTEKLKEALSPLITCDLQLHRTIYLRSSGLGMLYSHSLYGVAVCSPSLSLLGELLNGELNAWHINLLMQNIALLNQWMV